MELFDIGVNLTKPQFDRDRDAVIARARAAGVGRMALTGVDAASSAAAAELAAREGFVSTAGVHPHHAGDWPAQAARIAALWDLPQVRAVGECGLDFNRNFSTPAEQRTAFEAQLRLAADRGAPLFLHERDASRTMLDMLRAMGRDLPPAVLHCFTGDAAALEGCLELGLSIGITGWVCDERRGEGLRALVGRIPADRLMLETDAPYLLPRSMPAAAVSGAAGAPGAAGAASGAGRTGPRRGRNEPANLVWIAREVAGLRGEPVARVAAAATRAACRFFGV